MAAEPRKRKGANQSRSPLQQQAESYLVHHRKVARDSAERLWRTPIASMMTWAVMGVALALPVAQALGAVRAGRQAARAGSRRVRRRAGGFRRDFA